MSNTNRTDRILIAVALAILLMASGLFYFDDWMWGGRRRTNERIGVITLRSGDVRMKYTGDLKWQKAANGQDLIYNDAVYAGSDSQAKLSLGESEMTVTENTLVVLRRADNVNFMNLSYGSLFGQIAKNEKVIIDTGDNKPIELNTTSAAQVVIRKVKGRTELDVVSGEAKVKIAGKVTQINKASRIVVDEKEPAKVEQVALELVKPLRNQTIYSEQPGQIAFEWRWSSGRKAMPNDEFQIEFSSSPNFEKLAAQRKVKGALTTVFGSSQSVSLYYRVRGPHGEISAAEKVNFVRMTGTEIVRPEENLSMQTPKDQNATLNFEFKKPSDANVNLEVATDPDFKTIVLKDTQHDPLSVRNFPAGGYYLHARSDYGAGHTTAWSMPRHFSVEQQLEPIKLSANVPDQTHVLIPNRAYPNRLYDASVHDVENYLTKHGLLQNYFPFHVADYDDFQLKFDRGHSEGEVLHHQGKAWPSDRIHPGRYRYKYQMTQVGFLPSGWSSAKTMDIAMEPPHPIGDIAYGPTDASGVAEGTWAFTPLLFAKSYDVELFNDSSFRQPRMIQTNVAEVKAKLKGENYYRVRARDGQGRIISAFSQVYRLKANVPVFLAKNEPPPERKPALTPEMTTTTKVEKGRDENVHKSGWWAWLGGGENFVDYRQSVTGRSSLDDHHLKGISQYVEVGFIGESAIGGVISFKNTPGEIDVSNANIDHSSYTWTTLGVEALARKPSSFRLLGSPVDMDLRLGIQDHKMPFVFVDSQGSLELKNNEIMAASAGASVEWRRDRWTYYWLMRYQYPFSSRADGSTQYDISPIISFDGSVGTSYNFTPHFKGGLFWYGQLHEFNFTYSDGLVDNHGTQSIFYSNFDLRVGYDF